MASNSFGTLFQIVTWGESHGPAVGVVIDGCPAGLLLNEDTINEELSWRAPGRNDFCSPRKEPDEAQILSGVFEGVTTGTPISIMISNRDVDSSKYASIKGLMRPGHANMTYLQKYGVFDYRGGGRSSARETVCRVAAGAVAKALLERSGISCTAYLQQLADIKMMEATAGVASLQEQTRQSPVFCPEPQVSQRMMERVTLCQEEGDSVGGTVAFTVEGLPVGLGDPVYCKLEAMLASAVLSIPASKGFELGCGFDAVAMKGSQHNDSASYTDGIFSTSTNHSGGTLGGISTGAPVTGCVAFKPTSSIAKAQKTVTINGGDATFQLPEGSRHDPCVAIRAVPVVEAMVSLVVADALLMNRCAKL